MINLLNRGERGKNELNQKIDTVLKEMQLLETNILQKSETINTVTFAMASYHNEILNHIHEVNYLFCTLYKLKY